MLSRAEGWGIVASEADYQTCSLHPRGWKQDTHNLEWKTGHNPSHGIDLVAGTLVNWLNRGRERWTAGGKQWAGTELKEMGQRSSGGSQVEKLPSHWISQMRLILLPASVTLPTEDRETWDSKRWACAEKMPAHHMVKKKRRKQILKKRKRIQL